MPARLRTSRWRAVGAKQTLRALQDGSVRVVYIARDADKRVVRPIRELALNKNVEIVEVETMAGLGRQCGIAVGAACAGLLAE